MTQKTVPPNSNVGKVMLAIATPDLEIGTLVELQPNAVIAPRKNFTAEVADA